MKLFWFVWGRTNRLKFLNRAVLLKEKRCSEEGGKVFGFNVWFRIGFVNMFQFVSFFVFYSFNFVPFNTFNLLLFFKLLISISNFCIFWCLFINWLSILQFKKYFNFIFGSRTAVFTGCVSAFRNLLWRRSVRYLAVLPSKIYFYIHKFYYFISIYVNYLKKI